MHRHRLKCNSYAGLTQTKGLVPLQHDDNGLETFDAGISILLLTRFLQGTYFINNQILTRWVIDECHSCCFVFSVLHYLLWVKAQQVT
jgi:hypothetical protein